jgi:hypothetical protein
MESALADAGKNRLKAHECGRVQQNAAEFLPETTQMARELRTKRISVSLTEHEHEVLAQIADRSDLSLSRVVQEAIREFVKSNHSPKKVDVLRHSSSVHNA